ncbi:MAG: ATP synthase F1 subunit delta [Bacteroidia bacterium]|nr:ATP synthase F1 subunit delta [Bacteroidia bacterium]
MSEYRVSGRYAKSLIDLSQEKNILETIYTDIVAFKKATEQTPALVNMLKSPIINSDKKLTVIKEIFGKSFNPLTISFIEIVINKKREFYLIDIANAFIQQYNQINKITTARIKTATAISDAAVIEVKTFIEKQTGKKVVLETSVDPSLIGGLVIQMEDKLYDASISGKLKKAKQELLNTYISN